MAKIARFTPARIDKLLADPGIVRNRQKVEATVGNARAALEVAATFGSLSAYLWGFVDGRPRVYRRRRMSEIPAETPTAHKMAKAMRARGFRFFGPTIAYAHMQATGMVNDHVISCFRWQEVQA